MTLSVFTLSDLRRLQYYLNLPVDYVREGSLLWQALVLVEQLDQDEGTAIAADVQARLTALETIDSIDGSTGSLVDAIQQIESIAQRIRIPTQIEIDYRGSSQEIGPGKFGGQAAATQQYRKWLIDGIRRDIRLDAYSGGNNLRAEWPGGYAQSRRYSLYSHGRS